MVADVAYFRARGIRPRELQGILQGGGTSNNTVQRRVLGDVPLDWEDPGRFPPQIGPPDGKYESKEVRDVQVDLSTAGRGNTVSGSVGGGDVSPKPP